MLVGVWMNILCKPHKTNLEIFSQITFTTSTTKITHIAKFAHKDIPRK